MNDTEDKKSLEFGDDVESFGKFDAAMESAVDEVILKAAELLALEYQVKVSSKAGLQGFFLDSKLGSEEEARFDETVEKIKQYVDACCFDVSGIEDQASAIGRIKDFDVSRETREIADGLSSWDTQGESGKIPPWYIAPKFFEDGPAEIFKDVYVDGVDRRRDAHRDLLTKLEYSLDSVSDLVKSNRDAVLVLIRNIKKELDSYGPVWDYIWFTGNIVISTVGLGASKLGVQLALTGASLIYADAEKIIGQTSDYCVVDLMQLLRDGCDELKDQRNAVFSDLASSLKSYYSEVSTMEDEHVCPRPSRLGGSGQSIHDVDNGTSGPWY